MIPLGSRPFVEAALCAALECQPGDLLAYETDPDDLP